MLAVDVHSVSRDSAGKRAPFGFGRIGIDVEMREVAARDVDSNAMPALEQVARRKCLDADSVDFARNHRRRLLPRVSIAHAQYSVGEIHRKAFRIVRIRRIDVDQLGGEIGIGAIGRNPQADREGTSHFDIFAQRRRLEHQNVLPLGERPIRRLRAVKPRALALIESAADHDRTPRCDVAADRGDWVPRIVFVG